MCIDSHCWSPLSLAFFFFFQAEDGIRDLYVTGVQTVLFRSAGPSEKWAWPDSPLTTDSIHQLQVHANSDVAPNPHDLVWHRPDGSPKTNSDDNKALRSDRKSVV